MEFDTSTLIGALGGGIAGMITMFVIMKFGKKN